MPLATSFSSSTVSDYHGPTSKPNPREGDIDYLVIFQPSYGFAQSHHVKADRHETRGDDIVFVRDDAVVHRVPERHVARIETLANPKEAAERAREHMEQLRGAQGNLRIQEGGTVGRADSRREANPRAAGQVVEGVRVVIED